MGWFNFTTGVSAMLPDYGLSFEGVVTTYTDTTHFKASSLAGKGTGFFKPTAGAAYEIFVVEADGAAPEGEQTPVVAYTTADGTFQHAAFTVPLAVGDIVLIIHPLLASLGTKATSAATGAVTTTDYMMAYIKQLVTDLILVLADTGELQTDWVNNGRLDNLIDAIITDIASAVPEPPTAKSLQDILHKDTNYTYDKATDALEAIRDRIDTLLSDLQGSADTLEALLLDEEYGLEVFWALFNDLVTNAEDIIATLGATDTAAATGAVSNAKQMMAYVKQLVTAVILVLADTADLQGNQGAWATATGFATETKQDIIDTAVDGIQTDLSNTTDGLGALKTLIDILHGGVEGIQDIKDVQDAELDFARIQTLASPTTLDGSVQTIYSNTQGRPFYFAGGFISWDSGAWAGGESVTINVDVKVDSTNWENMWTITKAAAASPLSVAVPAHANSALLNIPMGFWNSLGVRVTVEQTVEGAGYGVISHEFHDGVPGS